MFYCDSCINNLFTLNVSKPCMFIYKLVKRKLPTYLFRNILQAVNGSCMTSFAVLEKTYGIMPNPFFSTFYSNYITSAHVNTF